MTFITFYEQDGLDIAAWLLECRVQFSAVLCSAVQRQP